MKSSNFDDQIYLNMSLRYMVLKPLLQTMSIYIYNTTTTTGFGFFKWLSSCDKGFQHIGACLIYVCQSYKGFKYY